VVGAIVLALIVIVLGVVIPRLDLGGGRGDAPRISPAVGPLLTLAGILILAVALAGSFFVQVDAGHVGVVTRFGAVTGTTFEQGLHVKTPIDDVTIMDVRVQKDEVRAAAASRDLQDVTTIIALNFHLDPSKASGVFQQVGLSFKERIVDPAIQESVKATTAAFTAEELITQREKAREAARQLLATKLERFNILVDELNIVDFKFSADFEKAIEAKQVAAQRVKEAENKLKQVEVEAQQQVVQAEASAKATVTRAEAEARANRLLTDSLSDRILQLESIKKWDGKLPQVTGGAAPFVNIPTPTAAPAR
jgi:regulator of protease activity HflC (stomatin/prohibitin superfamily)